MVICIKQLEAQFMKILCNTEAGLIKSVAYKISVSLKKPLPCGRFKFFILAYVKNHT